MLQTPNPLSTNLPINQEINNAVFKVLGSRCSLTAGYCFRAPGYPDMSGSFDAKGFFDHGTAFMTYSIEDPVKKVSWHGVLILHVPEWGNPHGYILCESIRQPGKPG